MKELLRRLDSVVTFSPADGEFRSKLSEIVIADADEECAELFSESSSDLRVGISENTIEEGVIRFLFVSDRGERTFECAFSVLNQDELADLHEQLSRQVELHSTRSTHDSPNFFVRKQTSNGLLGIQQAAQKLGCSQIFLKSKIPCTEYTYREVDGKTEILEYYWSQNLIDRLCTIKLNDAKTEDVKYIAMECCYGDCEWAEEILVSLGCPKSTQKNNVALTQGMTKRPAKLLSKKRTPPHPSRKKQQ